MMYPCIASNIGFYKVCVHLNTYNGPSKAVVYDFEEQEPSKRKKTEQFFGFVNFNEVGELGVDMRNIHVDQCCFFAYLTKSP